MFNKTNVSTQENLTHEQVNFRNTRAFPSFMDFYKRSQGGILLSANNFFSSFFQNLKEFFSRIDVLNIR